MPDPTGFEVALEHALRTDQPLMAMRAIAAGMLADGQPRDAVVRRFEEARGRLRAEGREEAEDVVLEVLDFLTGWCSPHMKMASPIEGNEAGR